MKFNQGIFENLSVILKYANLCQTLELLADIYSVNYFFFLLQNANNQTTNTKIVEFAKSKCDGQQWAVSFGSTLFKFTPAKIKKNVMSKGNQTEN